MDMRSARPIAQPAAKTRPSHTGERGIAPIVFIIGALFVILGAAGVAAYVFLDSTSHPSEETARYLPANTDIYFSLNLRPGADQLQYFREILTRYRDDPEFQSKIDKFVETGEEKTGIHFIDDVLPWLGPEVAVGFIDVGGMTDDPQGVAFAGISDQEAAVPVIRRFLDHLEEEEGAEFREDSYKGFTTFHGANDTEMNLAITDSYLVFATSETLLETTIDMMEESVDSLSERAEFKEAQGSVRGDRFSFMYVDVESVIQQLRDNLSDLGAEEALQVIEDRIPKVVGISGSFVDKGLRIDGYTNTPMGFTSIPASNPLGSAGLVPDDSLALLSVTGLKEALEEVLAQLDEGALPGFDAQDSLEDFELMYGLGLVDEILGLLEGEVALAFLPSVFSFDIFGQPFGAVNALALFQFQDQETAQTALDGLVDVLNGIGISFDEVEIEGELVTMADLGFFLADSAYAPSFIVLGDYLVLGSTESALSTAIRVRDGSEASLADEEEFSRLVKMMPGGKNSVLFLNIRDIRDLALGTQSLLENEEYVEYGAPFIDPMRALLAGTEMNEEKTRFTMVITIV